MSKIIFIVFFLINCLTASSQNLFDAVNSQKYAQHLYNSADYTAAAHELERVIFLVNTATTDSLHATLLSAYRLGKNADMGVVRAKQIFKNPHEIPTLSAFEYGKLLLQTQKFDAANRFFAQNNNLSSYQKNYLTATTHALNNQWQPAQAQYENLPKNLYPQAANLLQITQQAIDFSPKKPVAAAVLSGILPGMGKVYARDWKDGVISLIFVGSMAFQSYRGYQQKGFDSPRFWIYTTLGTGFYIANIYGGYQSARQYNQKFYGNLNRQITDIFYENK